ncbi:MAG TPA: VanZ family protein [Pyrinomonadaceae bacterium]|nr:VanZ family protein [Pyrinomonadaceae bacterium]
MFGGSALPKKGGARAKRAPGKRPGAGADGPRGRTRRRAWRYGPLAAWVGFIFFASTGNLSASNTSRILRPLLLWLFPTITEAALVFAHSAVRKGAHFAEYFVLALLAARAFTTSSEPGLRRRWWLASFALVAACALLDEYHQSFVATRTGTIYDSLIDMAGGATALVLFGLWRRARGGRPTSGGRTAPGGRGRRGR